MTDTTEKKPHLQLCLEQLEGLVTELRDASDQYIAMKALFQKLGATATLPEGADLLLRLPPNGQEVPLGLPASPTVLMEMLDASTSGYGERVLNIWQSVNAVVTNACVHCAKVKGQAPS
jgi:hypothetical protein